jgi:hypothetical protein
MDVRKLLNTLRWAIMLAATLFLAGVLPFATHGADGLVGVSGPVAITATPVVNLSDGMTVNVHALAASGTAIFSITAHTCMPGKVTGDHSFGFTSQFCSNVPIGTGEVEKLTTYPGGSSADFQYTVGEGSVSWYNDLGYQYALTCDPTHPCDMVLKIEITGGTQYVRVPLCYGTQCPADVAPGSPVPAGAGTGGTAPPAASAPPAAAAAAAASPPTDGSSGKSAPGASQSASALGGPSSSSGGATGGGTSRSTSGSDGQSLTAANAATVASSSRDSTRGTRVIVAAIAGAICGAHILSVISRTRKQARVGTA